MEKYFWIVLFSCGICFGQKGYDYTQGELVVISPQAGIVIKQNGNYFIFRIQPELEKGKLLYHTETQEIDNATLFDLLAKKDNIFPDQITACNRVRLKKIGFSGTVAKRTYTIRPVGRDFYTVIGNEEGHDYIDWAGLGFPIRFGSKEIMVIPELKVFIVSTEKDFRFIGEYKKIRNFKAEKVTGEINKHFVEGLSDYIHVEEFIYTDTINGLAGLRNCFDEIIAPPVYDSVVSDRYFIKCYRKSGVDLYNVLFQKLELKDLRACQQQKYSSPYLGILQGNKVKAINVLGKVDTTFYINSAPYMPSGEARVQVEIVKGGQDFFITNRGFDPIVVDGELFQESKRKLYLTEGIDSIISPVKMKLDWILEVGQMHFNIFFAT